MTTAAQQHLIDRLRRLLAEHAPVREVPMFGGRSFMVNGKLLVSAQAGDDLLVRIAADRRVELLERPGARQAVMGAGRTMGNGWIAVAADSIAGDRDLTFWLNTALEHNREVTKRLG
jgi:hypothetical protein